MQSLAEFEKAYNRMTFSKRFDLHRKYNLFAEDTEVENNLFAKAAKNLGLQPQASKASVLFALQNSPLTPNRGDLSGASCGCNSCETNLGELSGKKFELPKQNFTNDYEKEFNKVIDKLTKPFENLDKCYAIKIPISEIYTDPQRFQNRVDAFSELSANQVAAEYNENYFDPIVVWKDTVQGKIFVISGHSRLEGMKRRGEEKIPARFFQGTEQEAITFSRVIANRAANKENLIEDLKAYKLMRDGDTKLNLKPSMKKDLQTAFKGKHTKLEALTFLNDTGYFLQELNKENKELPYLESRARWVGDLRKELPKLNNNHEDEIFYFFYSGDKKGLKMEQDAFKKTVRTRLELLPNSGGAIFPECEIEGCTEIKECRENISKQTCERVQNLIEKDQAINNRFNTDDIVLRIYTEEEKEALKKQREKLQKELAQARKGLEFLESQAKLFGI